MLSVVIVALAIVRLSTARGVYCLSTVGAYTARLFWLLYYCIQVAPRSVYRCCRYLGVRLNEWAWGVTTAGRRARLVNLPAADHHASGLGRASWEIVNETVVACRVQLGLDRYSSHSDPATRQLVSKTCLGILTDAERFPNLRRTDAEKLVVVAREMALTPCSEEIAALEIGSSAPYARNRSLARGAWGVMPTTWFEWVVSFFSSGIEGQYLPPVSDPSF